MSDEQRKDKEQSEKWVMPKPVFRSSEGRTPRSVALDPQGDVPTEPGFHDKTTEEITVKPDAKEPVESEQPAQSVRESTKTRVRTPKKAGGCAKTFSLIVGAIALSIIAVVAILIYFLFFYTRAETAF